MYIVKVNKEKSVFVFRGRNNGCDSGIQNVGVAGAMPPQIWTSNDFVQ